MSKEQSSVAVKERPVLMNLPELERREGGAVAVAKNAAELPRRQKPGKNGVALPVGRPKGVPNKVTQTIREAVEIAAQGCHPKGFAGWLIERAEGGIEDRKIFASVLGRVIPLQIDKKTDSTIRIELGWLNGRNVGRNLAQSGAPMAQVIDIKAELPSGPLIKDQDAQHAATGRGDADGAGQAGGDGTA